MPPRAVWQIIRVSSRRLLAPLVIYALLGATAAACDEDEKHGSGGSGVGTHRSKVEHWTPKKKDGAATAEAEAAGAEKNEEAPEKPREEGRRSTKQKYRALSQKWGIGKVHDLGPAAPTTATPRGVLFVSKENRLYLAKHQADGTFTGLEAPPDLFAKYGRGPAVSKDHAYWISRSAHLVRGNLKTGVPEMLVDRARAGARVSVQRAAGRDIVGFIRQLDELTLAFVWGEGVSGKDSQELLRLSPEGSTATAIELVSGPRHPRAIMLEGRTSMSPIHLRTVRVTKRRLTLENDKVVWVGPGSHSLTELEALPRPQGRAVAFLATAKGITSFGLAQLWLDADVGEIPDPDWRLYPNGLDPAPVAAAHMCGEDWALFAVPTEKKPHSPQELRIAPLEDQHLGSEEILARSRAFNDVSIAALKNGAIVAWTADRRTWAVQLGCPKNEAQ